MGGVAQGAEITEDYDFATWGKTNMTANTYATISLASSSEFQVENTNLFSVTSITGTKTSNVWQFTSSRFAFSSNVTCRLGRGSSDVTRIGNEAQNGDRYISIINLKKGDRVTFKTISNITFVSSNVLDGETAVASGTAVEANKVYTIKDDGHIDLKGASKARANISNMTVTRTVTEDGCENPTYAVTGVNGIKRTLQFSCSTENAKIYYSLEKIAATDEGWTEVKDDTLSVTSPVVYVMAKKDNSSSDVVTVSTTAGTEQTMTKPTISRTGANSYKISVASTVVDGLTITPTINYAVGNGENKTSTSSSVDVTDVDADIKAWVSSEGMKNSETATMTYVAPYDVKEAWSVKPNDYIRSNADFGNFGAITAAEATTIGEWSAYKYNENEKANVYLTNNNNGWLFRPANSTAAFKCQSAVEGIVIDKLTKENVVEIQGGRDNGGTIINALNNAELAYSYNDYNFFIVPSEDGAIKVDLKTGVRITAIYVYNKQTTISLNSTYTYTTYCPESDLDFTNVEGVEAYAAKANESNVTLTQITGKVKAGEGIILKNVNNVESVSVPVTTDATALTDNDLKGVTADMTSTDFEGKTAYILVSDTEFQKVASTTAGILKKGKAYLLVSGDASAKPATLTIGGNATAISNVAEKADTQNAAIYNIQGMKVEKAVKGLYIVNGKKFVK